MIEKDNYVFTKAVVEALEDICDEIDKDINGKKFMLLVIVNKALSEVVGRPVTPEDFIDEKTHLKALSLVKEWISNQNYEEHILH